MARTSLEFRTHGLVEFRAGGQIDGNAGMHDDPRPTILYPQCQPSPMIARSDRPIDRGYQRTANLGRRGPRPSYPSLGAGNDKSAVDNGTRPVCHPSGDCPWWHHGCRD